MERTPDKAEREALFRKLNNQLDEELFRLNGAERISEKGIEEKTNEVMKEAEVQVICPERQEPGANKKDAKLNRNRSGVSWKHEGIRPNILFNHYQRIALRQKKW